MGKYKWRKESFLIALSTDARETLLLATISSIIIDQTLVISHILMSQVVRQMAGNIGAFRHRSNTSDRTHMDTYRQPSMGIRGIALGHVASEGCEEIAIFTTNLYLHMSSYIPRSLISPRFLTSPTWPPALVIESSCYKCLIIKVEQVEKKNANTIIPPDSRNPPKFWKR